MKNATIPFSLPAVINQSRYILVIYTGGWPSNHPPKVARIISCDTDAEYFTTHPPNQRKGEKAYIIEREKFGLPHPPTLVSHMDIIAHIHQTVEEGLS